MKRTRLSRRLKAGDTIKRDSLTITVLKGNVRVLIELDAGERCEFVNASRPVAKKTFDELGHRS